MTGSSEKKCTRCQEIKPIDMFSIRRSQKRDGHAAECKPCFNLRNAARIAADPEAWNARSRAYREANADKVRDADRAYKRADYEKNPEKYRERKKRWNDKNIEHVREQNAVWRAANPDKVRELRQQYKEKAHAQILASHVERRKRHGGRTYEQILADRARLRPDGIKRCRKCKEYLSFERFTRDRWNNDGLSIDCRMCRRTKLQKIAKLEERGMQSCVYCDADYQHIDHVLPVALGGLDVVSNLVSSCAPCNQKKYDMHPIAWLRMIKPDDDPYTLLDLWGIDYSTWETTEEV